MPSRMTLQQEQGAAIVEAWNDAWPVGTAVIFIGDDGERYETKTRSPAWWLGRGEPVVKVEGRTGGYLLSRMIPQPPRKQAVDLYPCTCGHSEEDHVPTVRKGPGPAGCTKCECVSYQEESS